ncbi:MAG: hypothetical protein KIT48_19540 [Pseudolabrys sp.]|nr:hypothetical protein [Pseudolabrys sp.]
MTRKTVKRIEFVVGAITTILLFAGLILADRYLSPDRLPLLDPDERDPVGYHGHE